MNTFRLGDTIALNKEGSFLSGLSEEQRIEYYGRLGYGCNKLKTFTFICEMHPQTGHCVLVEIGSGKIHTMCHIDEFYLVKEDDC